MTFHGLSSMTCSNSLIDIPTSNRLFSAVMEWAHTYDYWIRLPGFSEAYDPPGEVSELSRRPICTIILKICTIRQGVILPTGPFSFVI